MDSFAPAPIAVAAWRAALFVAQALAQFLLLALAAHRAAILWRWWTTRRLPDPPAAAPASWPVVTVQLPVYDERLVVERLIDAVAALDYPAGRLEIQVLDDSGDDTRWRASAAVARHRARGVDIRHLHRSRRAGYKAGALAAGLEVARGELVAVFDADFVPAPDFLRRIVPRFADPGVGLVQARWGHLNRDRSLLTRAQAALLDAHFRVEQEARAAGGLFLSFNGSAGVWRRRCIEDAGGWSHETLTEDLDLSYRAQLKGWRFVFDGATEVPAELPADLESFKAQQRRWVKGSIQTARKLLPALWRARLPWHVKLEGALHLTSYAAHPLLLGFVLVVAAARLTTGPVHGALGTGWVAAGLLPAVAFLVAGGWRAGARGPSLARDVAAALVLGVGLSLNNARAAWEGIGRRVGAWERTVKTGDAGGLPRLPRLVSTATGRGGLGELTLAFGFMAMTALAVRDAHWQVLPLFGLLVTAFGGVGAGALARRPRA